MEQRIKPNNDAQSMKINKRYKTLIDIFDELKQTAVENNLSLKDISDNTRSDPELVRIIFDEYNDVLGTISRVFSFLRIDVISRHRSFKPYRISDKGQHLKIHRVIDPRCSMVYNKNDLQYYRFKHKNKVKTASESATKIIQQEMKDATIKYLREMRNGKLK